MKKTMKDDILKEVGKVSNDSCPEEIARKSKQKFKKTRKTSLPILLGLITGILPFFGCQKTGDTGETPASHCAVYQKYNIGQMGEKDKDFKDWRLHILFKGEYEEPEIRLNQRPISGKEKLAERLKMAYRIHPDGRLIISCDEKVPPRYLEKILEMELSMEKARRKRRRAAERKEQIKEMLGDQELMEEMESRRFAGSKERWRAHAQLTVAELKRLHFMLGQYATRLEYFLDQNDKEVIFPEGEKERKIYRLRRGSAPEDFAGPEKTREEYDTVREYARSVMEEHSDTPWAEVARLIKENLHPWSEPELHAPSRQDELRPPSELRL